MANWISTKRGLLRERPVAPLDGSRVSLEGQIEKKKDGEPHTQKSQDIQEILSSCTRSRDLVPQPGVTGDKIARVSERLLWKAPSGRRPGRKWTCGHLGGFLIIRSKCSAEARCRVGSSRPHSWQYTLKSASIPEPQALSPSLPPQKKKWCWGMLTGHRVPCALTLRPTAPERPHLGRVVSVTTSVSAFPPLGILRNVKLKAGKDLDLQLIQPLVSAFPEYLVSTLSNDYCVSKYSRCFTIFISLNPQILQMRKLKIR